MFVSFSHMPSRGIHACCVLFFPTADRLRFCTVLSTVIAGWGWRLHRKYSWTLSSKSDSLKSRFFLFLQKAEAAACLPLLTVCQDSGHFLLLLYLWWIRHTPNDNGLTSLMILNGGVEWWWARCIRIEKVPLAFSPLSEGELSSHRLIFLICN